MSIAQNSVGIARSILSLQIRGLQETLQTTLETASRTAIEAEIASLKETINGLSEISAGLSVLVYGVETIQAFQSGDILNGIIDGIKTIASIVALLQPEFAPIIFAVIAVVSFFQSLFSGGGLFGGGNGPVWVPWGAAHLAPDGGGGVRVSFDWDYAGGGAKAEAVLNAYVNTINGLVGVLRSNGFTDAALIPERLNVKLDKEGFYGWMLSYNDASGSSQSIIFNSQPGTAPQLRAGSLAWNDPNYFRQDFSDTLIDIVLQTAIGTQWEADTARTQVAAHTGYGGQSAFAHMAQSSQLETNTSSPTETAKLIALDLQGLGYIP